MPAFNTSFVAGTRSGTLNLSATSITTVIPASTGDLTSNPLKFNVNATLGTASFILAVDAVIPVVTSSTGTYLSGKLKITGLQAPCISASSAVVQSSLNLTATMMASLIARRPHHRGTQDRLTKAGLSRTLLREGFHCIFVAQCRP